MFVCVVDIEGYFVGGVFGLFMVGVILIIGNYLVMLVVVEYLCCYLVLKISLYVVNIYSIVEWFMCYEFDIGLIEGEVNYFDLLLEFWLDDMLVVFCVLYYCLVFVGEVSW